MRRSPVSPTLNEISFRLFESQAEIIRLQSEAIIDLFGIVSQLLPAEELDSLPAIQKINEAAAIRAEANL